MGQRVRRRPESDWAELVQQWQSSGQTVDVFSAEHGVSAPRLQWWDAEFRRRSARSGSGRKEARKASVFVELRVVPSRASASAGSVEVHTRSGLVVRVQGSVDPVLLVSVLRAASRC